MATDTTGPAVNSSDFSARPIIMVAVGVIVLFAVSIGVVLMAMEHSRRVPKPAPTIPDPIDPDPYGVIVDPNVVPSTTDETEQILQAKVRRLQLQALQRSELARMESRLSGVRSEWETLNQAIIRWDTRIAKLLTGEDKSSRKIAGSELAVMQFVALQEGKRMNKDAALGLHGSLEELTHYIAITKAAVGSEELNTDKFEQDLAVVASEVTLAAKQYRTDVSRLNGIIHSAPAGNGNLQEAIAEYQQKTDKKNADRLTRDLKEVQEEEYQKTLQTEGELFRAQEALKRAKTELEKETVIGETKQTLTAAQLARRKKEEEAKYMILRKEALSQEVLSVLAPLVTPGYKQPELISGTKIIWSATSKKTGMSWTRLKSLKCLDDSRLGQMNIVKLCSYYGTERPRWINASSNPSGWSSADIERITKVREYLIKYGAVLAREGKLAE